MNRFLSMFFSIQIFRTLALAAASGRRGSAFWRTKGCGTSCENTASCGFNHLRWHPHRDPIFPIFPNIPSPLNHHRCLSPFLLIYGFERIIISRLIRNRMRCPRLYLSKDEISRNFVENYVEIHSIFLQWLINYGDPFSQENEQTVILLYRKKRFSRQEEDKSITSLCSFIKTLSGIVVTEKAATRMKFDAISSKAVGTISDYQQPRQSRVFGKSSFIIRTVSADYECLAQALRYAHPLPLLLTRRKRVLSFLDDSLPQFPTILLRARASLHEFRIHCPNILPWKSSALLDIASQTFVFVQRAVGHRSNAVNFKIGGGKMEEIGKGIETGFGFQSYALCLVLRVFEARGEGDWSSSTCPTLLGRFMEGKLASSSHFQVVSGRVDGLD